MHMLRGSGNCRRKYYAFVNGIHCLLRRLLCPIALLLLMCLLRQTNVLIALLEMRYTPHPYTVD